jgi:hypothetical protein
MCLPDPHTRATHARIHSKPSVARAVGERAVVRHSTTSSVLYGGGKGSAPFKPVCSNVNACCAAPRRDLARAVLDIRRRAASLVGAAHAGARHMIQASLRKQRVPWQSTLTVPSQYPHSTHTVSIHCAYSTYARASWLHTCARVRGFACACVVALRCAHVTIFTRACVSARASERVRALRACALRACALRACALRGNGYRQEVPVGRVARLLRDRPHLQRSAAHPVAVRSNPTAADGRHRRACVSP